MTIVRGLFLKDIPVNIFWSQTWPMAIIACVTLAAATWFVPETDGMSQRDYPGSEGYHKEKAARKRCLFPNMDD